MKNKTQGHTLNGVHTIVKAVDYPVLRKQLDDTWSTYYGPHSCEGCGAIIIKQALEQGAWEEVNEGEKYSAHHCTHIHLFKNLAGGVLTIVEAVFPPDSKQLKAIKDLLKRDFARVISKARELEGDRCSESNSTLEALATL